MKHSLFHLWTISFVLLLGILSCQNNPNKFILENDFVKVSLASEMPSIKSYRLKETSGMLLSNPQMVAPGWLIFEDVFDVTSESRATYETIDSDEGVVYHANIIHNDNPAIEFDLSYTLNGNDITIEFNNVIEHPGYYLIHVILPDLIGVESTETLSKLVIPTDAGRLVDVKLAEPRQFEYEIDWRSSILSGFVYNASVMGILDTESIENHTIASIDESDSARYGSLSTKIMHRLMEYDLEEFGPVVDVTDARRLLKVQDSSQVIISIIGDYDQDQQISWIDGTKYLREKIDATPYSYYADKTFVRTFVDRPPTARDTTGTREELPFDEVLERIRQFAAQTDSAACIMYLLGWQYEGHDSGYPSVDKVNENLGGKEALVNLIEEAKKYNVVVTFYDNYDDSYPNHPGWDPEVICQDPQGALMQGGVWEGNQSYLICPHKYVAKSALDRVRFTLNTYPIEKAYFIDVLAGGYNGGRKYDFDLDNPSGAQINFEAKKMIISEFNKRGIDVATEDFTGFFVGHVGTFGDIIAFDENYFEGEEEIPMIPFIYHSKTSFGMKISDRSLYVKTFLYGQRAQKFTNRRNVFTASDYILDALPKQKFYGKAMKSYRKEGNLETVIYEDGSTVSVDVKSDKYTVTLANGVVIAKDYTSFVPTGENTYLVCSRDGGLLSYSLPSGWSDQRRIEAFKLNRDGRKVKVSFKVVHGNIELDVEPNTPYKVVYDSP